MLEGRRALYVTPTYAQSRAFWWYICEWLYEPLKAGQFIKDETERWIIAAPTRTPSAGMLQCRTAWDADSMRGLSADLLLMDEFAMMDISAWNEVGAPMLAENDGVAWFISTPRRRNHFYNIFLQAQREMEAKNPRWMAWQFPSSANPYLSGTALQEIEKDITKDSYAQELLAEFLDEETVAFRNVQACLHAPLKTTPEEHANHYLVAGVDWGRSEDYTCISVVCRDCAREVARDRFHQIAYTYQRGRLLEMLRFWNVRLLVPEVNAMGDPVMAELENDPGFRGLSVRIMRFYTSSKSKAEIIDRLRLAFERELCQWQEDPIWTRELLAYEMTINPNTGNPSFGAREGLHDDTVMARALAWWGASQKRGILIG